MPTHLPDLIDPLVCADQGWRCRGKLPLRCLSRLRDMILNLDDAVDVDLSFAREGRTAVITGRVSADLEVICQRCLEPLWIEVRSSVNLGVVTSIDEGDLLPEPYEPLLLTEARIPFGDIVEDELILAIPPIPRHADCEPAAFKTGDATEKASERRNPFAELEKLKTDNS
ncbi:YceD family protein [Methylohalobius crimeensis]|uniref:YceD family protein n=1 Tax=Methylohalobius crimeensis TaxID=244365 RepID=UPI0003B67526|nr:YceD family protein [Methylohalobius crimeensis]